MSERRVRADGGAFSTPAAITTEEETQRARREREEARERSWRDLQRKISYDFIGWKVWIESQKNKVLDLDNKGFDDEVLERFTDGLILNAEANPGFQITEIRLGTSLITDLGLAWNFCSKLPLQYRQTLEKLSLSDNEGLKTVAALDVSIAGTFDNLRELDLSMCSISGVLPILQMPQLELLNLSNNVFNPFVKNPKPIIFEQELLRALPPFCKINLDHSKGQVLRGGEMDLVTLRERNGAPATVHEICKEAEIDCGGTLVKPARLTKARCGSCASPRPLYACAGCKAAKYCNEKCQAKDWSRAHHKFCGEVMKVELDDSDLNIDEEAFEEVWLLAWQNPLLRSILEEFVVKNTLRVDIDSFLNAFNPERRNLFEALDIALATEIPEGLTYNEQEGLLGTGATASVYFATDSNYNQYSAKVYEQSNSDNERERSMLQYVNRIDPRTRKSESRYVLGFFGYWQEWQGKPLLLAEYVDGDSLEKVFTRGPRRGFGLGRERYGYLSFIIPQLFIAIEFLHKKGIAHRDIKPDNILLDIHNKRAVLIDLGLSCVLDDNLVARRMLEKFSCSEERFGGSTYYQSPELAKIWLFNYTASGAIRQASFIARKECDIYAASASILRIFFGAKGNEEFFKDVLGLDFKFGPRANIRDTLREIAEQTNWMQKRTTAQQQVTARFESGLGDRTLSQKGADALKLMINVMNRGIDSSVSSATDLLGKFRRVSGRQFMPYDEEGKPNLQEASSDSDGIL